MKLLLYKKQNFSEFFTIFAEDGVCRWVVASIEDYNFSKKIAKIYFEENKDKIKKVYVRKTFGEIFCEYK